MDDDEIAQALTGNAAHIVNQVSGNADEYVNDPSIELAWAMKAHEHSVVHFNLLCAVDPAALKLTKQDDEIYTAFREHFPDLRIEVLTDHDLKSSEMKEEWRNFAESLKHIEDYNYGTLLRLDAGRLYDSDNTIFANRIQFLAIEIARNREGVNSAKKPTFMQLHAAQAGLAKTDHHS